MPVHNTYIPPQAIYLQSSFGTALNSTGSHMSFELRDPIVVPANIDCYVQMTSFRYSNLFYNVSANNNTLYYSLSNDISTVWSTTVPVGNYTAASLIEWLNEDLADSSMVFEYDPITFRITITNAVYGFIIRTGESSLGPSIGFHTETTQDVSATGDGSINLGGTAVVNIALPGLHLNSNSVAGHGVSFLDSVLNDVLIGSSKSVSNYSATKFKVNNSVVSVLEVQITGDNGIELDFQKTPWYLVLQLSFVYKYQVIAPPPRLIEPDVIT